MEGVDGSEEISHWLDKPCRVLACRRSPCKLMRFLHGPQLSKALGMLLGSPRSHQVTLLHVSAMAGFGLSGSLHALACRFTYISRSL